MWNRLSVPLLTVEVWDKLGINIRHNFSKSQHNFQSALGQNFGQDSHSSFHL